tara:strand:- start:897 stop:1121 length:225 start_codon:yes stop_codon:yes gene_type:complete
MKKAIITPENPKGILVDLTAEEISQKEQADIQGQADMETMQNKITENNNLKASAKAKLISGEALTEAEADTIVL